MSTNEGRKTRAVIRAAAFAVLLALNACVLEEPVFRSGLSRPSESLGGVWETMSTNGAAQHAVLFPLGEETGLLQYPVATNGWWFEAQSVRVGNREVLQLRILAGPNAQPAEAGGKNYTLAWLETKPDGTMQMRALDGQSLEKRRLSADSLRELLSDPAQDWDAVFGSPSIFRRVVAKK